MELGLIVGAYGAIRGYFKDRTNWIVTIDDHWFEKREYNTILGFSVNLSNNSNRKHSIAKCWLEILIDNGKIIINPHDFKPENFEQGETKKIWYNFYLDKKTDIEFARFKSYDNKEGAMRRCGLDCSLFLMDNHNKRLKQTAFVREAGFWDKFK